MFSLVVDFEAAANECSLPDEEDLLVVLLLRFCLNREREKVD